METKNEFYLSSDLIWNLKDVLVNVSKWKTIGKLVIDIEVEFLEMIEEMKKCNKIDDLSKQSVYIESEFGDVVFNLLKIFFEKDSNTKLENIVNSSNYINYESIEDLFSIFRENINILRKRNTDRTLKLNEKYVDKIEYYELKNIFRILITIYSELKNRWYVKLDYEEILNNISKKFERRYREIKRWNLSKKDKDFNDIWWEWCKANEEKEKKQESKERELWYQKSLSKWKVFDLLKDEFFINGVIDNLQEVDKNTTIIVFNKVIINEIVLSMKKMWCDLCFSRKWFSSINLSNWEKLVFISTKWIESMTSFSDIEEKAKNVYYIWWEDMTKKYQSINWEKSLVNLEQIESELIFWTKTELLLLADKDSTDKIISWENPSIIATKFSPILTKNATKKLKSEVEIISVDSNSESLVQVLKWNNPWDIIAAVEIVQSGSSVKDTDNYIFRNEFKGWKDVIVVYKPCQRKPWEDFSTKDIYNILENPSKELFDFIKALQLEVNVNLAMINNMTKRKMDEILSKNDKNTLDRLIRLLFKKRWKELANFKKINL